MAICVLIPTYCRAADKGRKENSEKLERRQKSKCYREREGEGGEKRPICTKMVGVVGRGRGGEALTLISSAVISHTQPFHPSSPIGSSSMLFSLFPSS